MPATINGDYSSYPSSIRGVFPHLAGEACELRQSWEVYSHLFMSDKARTELLANRLGGVLGMFQSLLADEMTLSISRLTDKDSRAQTNLSLWALQAAIPDAKDAEFGKNVNGALDQIIKDATSIRKHRHKRLAHYDLAVSLSAEILPTVTFNDIRKVVEKIEALLNLFYWEFENTTMFFDTLPATDLTGKMEATAYKAHAYDLL